MPMKIDTRPRLLIKPWQMHFQSRKWFRFIFGVVIWTESVSIFFVKAFAKMFDSTPDDLDMFMIYDVSHNIAKVEEHFVDGKQKTLLVHRKGSTRAFPPHHPLIPVDYQVRKWSMVIYF